MDSDGVSFFIGSPRTARVQPAKSLVVLFSGEKPSQSPGRDWRQQINITRRYFLFSYVTTRRRVHHNAHHMRIVRRRARPEWMATNGYCRARLCASLSLLYYFILQSRDCNEVHVRVSMRKKRKTNDEDVDPPTV